MEGVPGLGLRAKFSSRAFSTCAETDARASSVSLGPAGGGISPPRTLRRIFSHSGLAEGISDALRPWIERLPDLSLSLWQPKQVRLMIFCVESADDS